MTEPKKSRAKPPAQRSRVDKGKTVLGQTIVDASSTTGPRAYPDDVKAAAKALYEGDPNITKQQVAAELGIPYGTVDMWSKGGSGSFGERWEKKSNINLSDRAQMAADNYRGQLSELGPEITTEQQMQAVTDAAEQTAVELRAQVLDRHRKEWNAPRKISYEAVTERNFEKAKLAKITAETLKLVQDGERKAWGIDRAEGDGKVTVVIERE